jgi:hypothetical protein
MTLAKPPDIRTRKGDAEACHGYPMTTGALVARAAARPWPGGHRLRQVAFREGIPGPAGALSCLLLADRTIGRFSRRVSVL